MGSKRLVVVTKWGCEDPFRDMYDSVLYNVPSTITPDDTLVLEGGTDISTTLYHQAPSKRTQFPDRVRDMIERRLIISFADAGASILAICRGAQLATAFVGGKLIQHVRGHNKGHLIHTDKGDALWSSSLHHQMMYPFELKEGEEYKLLGWSHKRLSNTYINQHDEEFWQDEEPPVYFKEPEIVWYPKIRALAIQGHPEYMKPSDRFVKHCRNLVEEYLFNANH